MSIRSLTLSEVEEVSGGGAYKVIKEIAKSIATSEAWEATKAGAQAAGRELGYRVNSSMAGAITQWYQDYYNNRE